MGCPERRREVRRGRSLARATRVGALAGLLAVAAACAPRPGTVRLPSGPATASSDAIARYDEATRRCRGIDEVSAEVALSGRVSGRRVRARLLVGLARPDGVRVEALAPFGAPVFVLTGRDGDATLLMPRENRVVSDVPAEAILDALAGLAFSPADLLALVSGCLSASGDPSAPLAFGAAWRQVTLGDGEAWVRLDEGPARLVAGRQGDYAVEYSEFVSDLPRRVRISTPRDRRSGVDLALDIRQIDVAPGLDARAFEAMIPAGVVPMTLDELRRGGLLGR